MATMGQFPLSHSRANADSLKKQTSTGQNPPGFTPHPAESAQCNSVYYPFVRNEKEERAPHAHAPLIACGIAAATRLRRLLGVGRAVHHIASWMRTLVGLLADVRQLLAQSRPVAHRAPEQVDDAAEFGVARSHGFVVGLRGVFQPGLGARLSLLGGLHRRATGGELRLDLLGLHTLFRQGGAVIVDQLAQLRFVQSLERKMTTPSNPNAIREFQS